MVALSVQIDNRFAERQRDQRAFGNNSGRRWNRLNDKKKRAGKENSRWPEPIELDATGKRPPSKEEMERRRREKRCFECGLPGHIASSHRQNNEKKQWKPKKKQLNATGA